MKVEILNLRTRENIEFDKSVEHIEFWNLNQNIVYRGYLYQIQDIRRDFDKDVIRIGLMPVGVPKD